MKYVLEIQNIHAQTAGKEILKGVDLLIRPGEIHAIMGPNGAGKSTLARLLAGDPAYEITEGKILLNGEDLTELDPEERSHRGLFIGFQYPIEIPGVTNFQFLHAAYRAKQKFLQEPLANEEEFSHILNAKMALVEAKKEFQLRNVNEGFSGGEKKRNEIVQMAVLDPKIAILDETDSGLDIDAMRVIAQGILSILQTSREKSLLLITHYQRLLDYIQPQFIHILMDGKIIKTGGPQLALELEKQGYHAQ